MKEINYKRYKAYKLIITIILASMMGTFVGLGNFIAALTVFVISIILIMLLKKRVKSILSDERAEHIGGKAARIVLTLSALLMTIVGIILVSLRDENQQFLLLGNTLLLLECGMLLLYGILFRYYSNKK